VRLFGGGIDFGDVFAGERAKFAANDVGGKAGTEQTAVEGSDLVLADFASGSAELAFDALTDERGFVGGLGDFVEGGFDVAVGDTAGAEVAGDAEPALFADFGALAGELFGVTGVVDVAGGLEAVHHFFDEGFVVAAALESLLHFMDGMGAAHEDFDGSVVEGRFGVVLARLGEHEKKMKQGSKEVKRERRGSGEWRGKEGKRFNTENTEAEAQRAQRRQRGMIEI